jgi:hypothetical protein
MSRNVAKSTYKPIVPGKPNYADVRDPFTGLPVRTDAQERVLVDEEIDEQLLHPHAEPLEQEYDEDDNLMDLGVPLPFPVDILPDHDVDDWLLEVCREDSCSVDSAPVHTVQLTEDGVMVVMMPAYQTGGCRVVCQAILQEGTAQHEARVNPFAFFELWPITFKDQVVMCCSCDYPGCDRSEADKDVFASEMQMPDQSHRSRAAALGYCNTLFRCVLKAVQL